MDGRPAVRGAAALRRPEQSAALRRLHHYARGVRNSRGALARDSVDSNGSAQSVARGLAAGTTGATGTTGPRNHLPLVIFAWFS